MLFHIEASSTSRTFLQLIGCCCRFCDGLYIEPQTSGLGLRAVNSSKSTHLLLQIPRKVFDVFEWRDDHENGEFHILSKALLAGAIRSCGTLVRVVMHYDSAQNANELRVVLETVHGLRKNYSLYLNCGASEKAHVSGEDFGAELVGDPRMWNSILSSIPTSVPKVALYPGPHRFVLRGTNPARPNDEAKLGTMLSVDPRQFLQYRYAPHPIAVTPTPSHAAALGGKIVEGKPIRMFCNFVDQLQMLLRMSFDGHSVPVMLDACADPERGGEPIVSHCSLLVAALDAPPDETAVSAPQVSQPPAASAGRLPSAILAPSPSKSGPSRVETAPQQSVVRPQQLSSVSDRTSITPASAKRPRESNGIIADDSHVSPTNVRPAWGAFPLDFSAIGQDEEEGEPLDDVEAVTFVLSGK